MNEKPSPDGFFNNRPVLQRIIIAQKEAVIYYRRMNQQYTFVNETGDFFEDIDIESLD